MAVFEKHICPDDVRHHLCLNAARLTTHDRMKEEVAGVLLARQGRAAASGDPSGATPMDMGWIGCPGKGKDDKGKKGKGKGDKGKKDGKGTDKSADKSRARRARRTRRSATGVGARSICKSIATARRSARKARDASTRWRTAR